MGKEQTVRTSTEGTEGIGGGWEKKRKEPWKGEAIKIETETDTEIQTDEGREHKEQW